MIQKIEVVLKIAKNTFFSSLFQVLKKAWKKTCFFCDFKDHFHLFDHQTTLKNIAWILYDFCIFGILKKTHKFVKIGKTSGNTLEGIFWYGEIMSLQLRCENRFPKSLFCIRTLFWYSLVSRTSHIGSNNVWLLPLM